MIFVFVLRSSRGFPRPNRRWCKYSDGSWRSGCSPGYGDRGDRPSHRYAGWQRHRPSAKSGWCYQQQQRPDDRTLRRRPASQDTTNEKSPSSTQGTGRRLWQEWKGMTKNGVKRWFSAIYPPPISFKTLILRGLDMYVLCFIVLSIVLQRYKLFLNPQRIRYKKSHKGFPLCVI